MQENEYTEHGLLLEDAFHSFLWWNTTNIKLPNCRLFQVPHSGKGREDPSFDVILEFDYVYYFDVVGTYCDDNSFRLYTGKKDFYKLIEHTKRDWDITSYKYPYMGRETHFEPGIPYLTFQLKTYDFLPDPETGDTTEGWFWYCIEIKEDSYFIDYTSDLRVSKELVSEAIALEDSFSYVHARYKTIPLIKDRDLWFNQDLEYKKREVMLQPPRMKKWRKHYLAKDISEM